MKNQEFVVIKHEQTVVARYEFKDEYLTDKSVWDGLLAKHNQNHQLKSQWLVHEDSDAG